MLKLLLLSQLALVAVVHGRSLGDNLCTEEGFFALGDNNKDFIGCFQTADGLISKYLNCRDSQVFSKEAGHCVPQSNNDHADVVGFQFRIISDNVENRGEDIQNPTIPTETTEAHRQNADDDTTEHTDNPDSTESTVHPEDTTGHTDDPNTTETTAHTDTTTENPNTTAHPEDTTGHTDDPNTTETTSRPGETTTHTDNPNTTKTTKQPNTTENPTETTSEPEDTTNKPTLCPFSGFFPQSGDCTTYSFCRYEDDELVRYEFKCPAGMNFNPEGFCSTSYVC